MRFIGALVLALLAIGGFVAIVYGISSRSDPVTQPIAFNHAVHVNEAGMECLGCHTNAETAVAAALPGKNICLDCHDIDEEEQTHPEKDKLFAFDDVEHDIPWVRIAVTKPDVFFTHRRHVTAAKLDCLQCHPDQPALTAPPSAVGLVMTMDDCLACHEQSGASTDCLACHR